MRLIDAEDSELQRKLKFIREAEHQIYGGGSWGFTAKCEHAIEDAPTVQPEPHWISATERLPEIRHDVLFTVFFHETWRTMQGYRQDGEFMFWYNGRLESALDNEHRVSAWMPLPEPYKESEVAT